MRSLTAATAGAALALTSLLLPCAPSAPSAPSATLPRACLDMVELDFVDQHQGGRVVALVRAELWREDRTTRLLLRASAVGVDVAPMPGFEGLRGGNRRTAQELSRLASQDSDLRFLVRRLLGDERHEGSARAGRRGHLPMRRLRPDGSLDLAARDPVERVLELLLDSGPLGSGPWVGEVWVGERRRLVVVFSIDATSGRISDLRGDEQPL